MMFQSLLLWMTVVGRRAAGPGDVAPQVVSILVVVDDGRRPHAITSARKMLTFSSQRWSSFV